MPVKRKLQITASSVADLTAQLQQKLGLAQPIGVLVHDAEFDEDCVISELGDIAGDRAKIKVVPLQLAGAEQAAVDAKLAAAEQKARAAEKKAAAAEAKAVAAAKQVAAEKQAAAEQLAAAQQQIAAKQQAANAEAEARRKAEAAPEAKRKAEAAVFELAGAGTAAANGLYYRDGACAGAVHPSYAAVRPPLPGAPSRSARR